MLFGEIVEPSTRAFILEEDLDALPEYKGPVFQWDGDSKAPETISKLIFADSPKVLQICQNITKSGKTIAEIKDEGILICKSGDNYLVLYKGVSKNAVIGEIVDVLTPWIKAAKEVHCITTALTSSFQPSECIDTSTVTFTKCLTNLESVPFNFCDRLQAPNLVNGFGANVLSYCVHNALKASLWIIYSDNLPLDSLNGAELVRLFKSLGFFVNADFKVDSSSSNLYM
ncbi:uncharacterized protein LOC126741138 [Anthonomus grandis grandis]|uniref:uncharacterized protein LOC126741138 n=1 Tax=Anthonomus grandis grandis TaxID=2921223 RepID=UPI002165BA67|nr:uncharacterized protein LOC126741138 [Anthonomus grandis grandis]